MQDNELAIVVRHQPAVLHCGDTADEDNDIPLKVRTLLLHS